MKEGGREGASRSTIQHSTVARARSPHFQSFLGQSKGRMERGGTVIEDRGFRG